MQCFPNEAPPIIGASLQVWIIFGQLMLLACISLSTEMAFFFCFIHFQKLIVICLDGGDEREPYKTAVKAYAGAILARLLVMNSNYLAHLTGEPALTLALQQSGVLLDQMIILCLADFWLDKVNKIILYLK